MPYSDELDRQYTSTEARFWREIQHVAKNTPGSVRPYPVAQQFGIDKQRMEQHLKTWDNDGLIRFIRGGTYQVTLTPFGREFRFEESYGDIE